MTVPAPPLFPAGGPAYASTATGIPHPADRANTAFTAELAAAAHDLVASSAMDGSQAVA